jgi:hypothetical protein
MDSDQHLNNFAAVDFRQLVKVAKGPRDSVTLAFVFSSVSEFDHYGYCPQDGIGVPINKSEAARYFKLSADQNDAAGQNHYGGCLMYGIGVPINRSEAVRDGCSKLCSSAGRFLGQNKSVRLLWR